MKDYEFVFTWHDNTQSILRRATATAHRKYFPMSDRRIMRRVVRKIRRRHADLYRNCRFRLSTA